MVDHWPAKLAVRLQISLVAEIFKAVNGFLLQIAIRICTCSISLFIVKGFGCIFLQLHIWNDLNRYVSSKSVFSSLCKI